MDYKSLTVSGKNHDKYKQYIIIKTNGKWKINVTVKIHFGILYRAMKHFN